MIDAPLTWRVLVRRGWLLVLGGLVGLLAASALADVSVSATSAFHVSVQGGGQTPYQASRLARTYAQLLPEAPGVVRIVANETGLTREQVRDELTMSAKPGTALVFARFSARDGARALTAIEALTRAFRTVGDRAGSRLNATIAPLSDPTLSNGFSRTRALALGGLAGLLLAFVLVLVLERRSPRVDDLRDLARILPAPVSHVRARTLGVELAPLAERAPPGATALVIRRGMPAAAVADAWRERVASGRPPATVLLVDPPSPLARLRAPRDGVRAA